MPSQPALSPWAEVLAADNKDRNADWVKMDGGVISKDSFARGFQRIAKDKCEWAGLPVPLNGERLFIEKSYAYADIQDRLNYLMSPPDATMHVCRTEDVREDVTQRNEWWSKRKGAWVVIWQEGKRFSFGLVKGNSKHEIDLRTLGCSEAWSLATEYRAMETLRSLVRHHQFRLYFLTGSFLERSKRSGVMYMFRRLRPTLAISMTGERTRVMCALCLHPVALYEQSFAGACCPTDDVIAHLMLCRGDEHMYWRRANQHPPDRPEAGL